MVSAAVGLRESPRYLVAHVSPLWSLEGLRVGMDVDHLLDVTQSPILLLLYHFHIIPVYHMV